MAKKNAGYIKVNKNILYNPMYQDGAPFSIGKVLFDLNLRALFVNTDKPYRNRMEHLKRGQVEGSYREMCRWWNLSDKTVDRRLKDLEESGYIYRDILNGRTLITLVKYGLQQDNLGFDYEGDSETHSEGEYEGEYETDSETHSDNFNKDKEYIKNDKKKKKKEPTAHSHSFVGEVVYEE